jgi:3-methyladenine DNA glycosylase AlkD
MTGADLSAQAALAEIAALGDPARAAQMAAYHKTARRCLGVPVPQVTGLADAWRAQLTLEARLALAAGLWETDVHEGRVAAAKLLTQARIRPDDSGAWALICLWVPQFDGWALADHATIAGQKRLLADPGRLATVEGWTAHPNLWVRRAALVITLPFARMNFPKAGDLAVRAQALTWAAAYVADREWFIQKAVAWWIRDLSRHDAAAARAFLDAHGAGMAPFARKEAASALVG